jgi:putative NADPH-quinone reductase
MRALIIVAHPNSASFSHAMADAARETFVARGLTVATHDLYAEGFNPVQPTGEADNTASQDPLVERHCADLVAVDFILVFHPNWWGQPPAILKGWIDRVFRLDTAYGYPAGTGYDGVPVGLLKARAAFVFNTSNTPPDRERDAFGDPLQDIWTKCVFPLCGVEDVTRRMYGPMSGSTADQRAAWLAEVRGMVAAKL